MRADDELNDALVRHQVRQRLLEQRRAEGGRRDDEQAGEASRAHIAAATEPQPERGSGKRHRLDDEREWRNGGAAGIDDVWPARDGRGERHDDLGRGQSEHGLGERAHRPT